MSIGRAMIASTPRASARKSPHDFRGEAYFANDRQMARFVR